MSVDQAEYDFVHGLYKQWPKYKHREIQKLLKEWRLNRLVNVEAKLLELSTALEALTRSVSQIQGVQPGSPEDTPPPDFMWDKEKGKMRTLLPHMPIDQG